MSSKKKQGDPESFKANWKIRKETYYNHFTNKAPENQIQLAFRSHFEVFTEILERYPTNGNLLLETGCGRGTISNYFAKAGWNVTLLDYNKNVLNVARKIFNKQNLKAKYVQGDALNLNFRDNSFDIVTNIGLLEHFEDVETIIKEQLRVLKPMGWCFSYIVPERPDNIQKYFNWLNYVLRFFSFSFLKKKLDIKPNVFRSQNYSKEYISFIDKKKVKKIETFGMYPLPMISHSPNFPFSLLPQIFELALTKIFLFILNARKLIYRRHGWKCDEKIGQAFLIAFQKK